MATLLNKPVRRVSNEIVRDGAKIKQLIVTMYPDGMLGLRPKGTRREEFYPFTHVYSLAIKARVADEKAAKKKGKKK